MKSKVYYADSWRNAFPIIILHLIMATVVWWAVDLYDSMTRPKADLERDGAMPYAKLLDLAIGGACLFVCLLVAIGSGFVFGFALWPLGLLPLWLIIVLLLWAYGWATVIRLL